MSLIHHRSAPVTASHRSIRRALIAEDDPAFERLIRRAILGLGGDWQIHTCVTGEHAMQCLKSATSAFDLALIDLGLPYVSGIEVIRSAHERFPKMPIAVISVIASEKSVLAAIQAGAKGYVLKDDSELSISRAIELILEGIYPVSLSLAKYLFKLASGQLANEPSLALQMTALTPKELAVLQHLSQGHSYAETAVLMGISLSTVQSHIRKLYRKLDVRSQSQAVLKAQKTGLL
jgi:DNA-binding NarL/FixJ family response regulator